MTDKQIDRVVTATKRHQALSLVLQGFSREYICEEVGLTPDALNRTLNSITQELDSELDDLRETILAVSMFRLEDLITRNYAILNRMEKAADEVEVEDEPRGPRSEKDPKKHKVKNIFSVRDYNSTSKLIHDLIKAQIDLLTPRSDGRPAKNGGLIAGSIKALPDAPSTIQETDDRYSALLLQVAEDAGIELED